MEIGLALGLGVLCGACVLVKMLSLHARHRQLSGLQVALRDYQAIQRDLKAVLHEENRVRAREQGLARTQSRLHKQLGAARRAADALRKEIAGDAREERSKANVVTR